MVRGVVMIAGLLQTDRQAGLPQMPSSEKDYKRISVELPVDLVEALDIRRDNDDKQTRGEVLTELLSWMTKNPLEDN